ncbi:MAG: lipoprotein signal peptidase [Bacteroidota bacterium]|nr:lipoprotein signal peptidase [Bacteroidota bacterium]
MGSKRSLSLTSLQKAVILIFLILIVDQVIKIWVKTTMCIGDSHTIFPNWFFIHFTENEGMAYGMKLGGSSGKLILSVFRIIAVILIGWWLYRLTKQKAHMGLIVCVAMIFAGAMGNIIDSAFYGLIFSESSFMQVATLFPKGGGYAGFLYGKVVDMLYFPIIETHYPQWIPGLGGQEFIFFSPVFNISDSSITTGVILLLIFQKKFFTKKEVPAGNTAEDK